MPAHRGWSQVALAGSLVLHGAVVVAIVRAFDRPRPPDDEDEEEDGDPFAVALVRPDGLAVVSGIELVTLVPASSAAASATTAAPATVVAVAGGRGARGTGGTMPGPSGGEPAGTGTGTGTGLLGMRGRRHDLSLSAEAMARILDGGPEVPDPVTPTGKIQRRGAEGKIDDTVATVRVHADGTVDLKGKPHVSVHVGPPIPTMEDLRVAGRQIAEWYENPYKRRDNVGRMQDLPRHQTATEGACSSWGDASCEPMPADGAPPRGRLVGGGETGVLPLGWGKLDISGYLMEKLAGDPYAARKLKLLDETREERIATGTAFRAEQQARSAELVQRNLAALWRARTDPAERRAALFAMWDECTEDEAGLRARAMVLGWIRTHLPAGSPGAYTATELAKLDGARGSAQHFAPY
ncbi:MAG: hypothetical protein KIT31_32045 [Deltaproteobacteria bacterium]|nr:hypothetical protein [Deltaproteobacteria bacterium]